MKIAIQGQDGSYHDIATGQFFGDSAERVSCDSFADVFKAVAEGRVEAGVCALENSLYGSINDVYDLLVKYDFWIDGEVYLPIRHQLIGLPGAVLSDIREIHSQAPALGQCEDYLDTHLANAQRVEQHDTAASVALVKSWGDPAKAAIASQRAAELHGLSILAADIEDHHENYTRFIVLYAKEPANSTDSADKTSLILTTSNKVGALHQALGAFADNNINLTKLQSRPIAGERWKYMFYVDIESGLHDNSTVSALKKLEAQDCTVRILGSYARAHFED